MSFDDYVRLRGERLVRLARVLVRDRYLAEDLVQEVLGKAYARWDRISRVDDPDMYLRRMLVNSHISWRRKRSSSEVAADIPSFYPDRSDGGDIGTETVERDAAWRLIADLPPKQRTTLVLRYYEDLDDATIARIMRCSPVTVRTQAMRALATLRARLAGTPALNRKGGTRR
ncbi:SigE family RNA polymerase sigma factor [Dactylosporangium sp. AC04546]|uniref:SigE family RNA polymerase sigma factor n=1 Tax=Dactylosporangium sp. AC04546 TaxID=2862460 RepID=UPI001EE06E49|nr:SigE family RNA polymerase sigma factor [Dactylosporangium sp. AC04546]WVK89435.1 SigE family RNA polymerase sigma factor [Dactylosporangium sp. AC04546]